MTVKTEFSFAERAQFQEKGLLVVRGLLSPDDVASAQSMLDAVVQDFSARLRRASGDLETVRQRVDGQELVTVHRTHSRALLQCEPNCDPQASDVAALRVRKIDNLEDCQPLFDNPRFASKVQATVRAMLGEEPVLFNSMSMFKPAAGGMEMPWHQDTAYLTFDPPSAVVVVWIALDAAHADNGCLKLLPCGHHHGPLRHQLPVDGSGTASKTVVVAGGIDGANLPPLPIEYAELEPGDGLVFFSLVPHATERNESQRSRRSLQYHLRRPSSRCLDASEYRRLYPNFWGAP